jgi:hypothetical protein
LRRASVRAIAAKLPDEKSIQRDAVAEAAREHRAAIVLCGHAHAFRDEKVGETRWIVLDAFGGARDQTLVGRAAAEFPTRPGPTASRPGAT